MPATLPQLLRSHCLHMHRRPSARPSQNPTIHYSPTHIRPPSPQHPASSAHSRRSQAPAHSAAARRCTQRTAEVQRRQLRHPQETRCQRRCPSCSNVIDCTHRRPSARPSQTPPPATAPRATAPANNTRHHHRIAGGCNHPPTAQAQPMHAAYHGGPATSAAPSSRDSVPATLPKLL